MFGLDLVNAMQSPAIAPGGRFSFACPEVWSKATPRRVNKVDSCPHSRSSQCQRFGFRRGTRIRWGRVGVAFQPGGTPEIIGTNPKECARVDAGMRLFPGQCPNPPPPALNQFSRLLPGLHCIALSYFRNMPDHLRRPSGYRGTFWILHSSLSWFCSRS